MLVSLELEGAMTVHNVNKHLNAFDSCEPSGYDPWHPTNHSQAKLVNEMFV